MYRNVEQFRAIDSFSSRNTFPMPMKTVNSFGNIYSLPQRSDGL